MRWFSSRNCLTFFWYPPPPFISRRGTPFRGGDAFVQKEIAGQYAGGAIDRLSINHARSNQTCCRVYTEMAVCVQERTGDGGRWRDIACGVYADCSACNPPWYLIDLKKGCTPTLYSTDILYLTISRLSFGQTYCLLTSLRLAGAGAHARTADMHTGAGAGTLGLSPASPAAQPTGTAHR